MPRKKECEDCELKDVKIDEKKACSYCRFNPQRITNKKRHF